MPVELILAPPVRRSPSTTSPAGRARRSCRCRSSRRFAPCGPRASACREIGAQHGASVAACEPEPLRRRAIATAERWVRERQEADGGWGGIQPPWVWSILMLAALGHGFEDERCAVRSRAGAASWSRTETACGRRRASRPVWDTALAVLALRACGVPADHPQLVKAGEWLLGEEVTVAGRLGGAATRPRARRLGIRVRERPLSGRRRLGGRRASPCASSSSATRPCARGLAWIAGMQSADGGWGAFDADNSSTGSTSSPSATSAPSSTRRPRT